MSEEELRNIVKEGYQPIDYDKKKGYQPTDVNPQGGYQPERDQIDTPTPPSED